MIDVATATLYSASIGVAEALGLGTWEFALSVVFGAAAYFAGQMSTRWVQARARSFSSGTSVWGMLGLRPMEDRVFRGRVTRVFDGDTIEVNGDKVVRLIGIDAPEKEENEKCQRDEKITGVPSEKIIENGKEASYWLKRTLRGREVELELDRQAGRVDQYGRTLAHVWTVGARGRRDGLVAESLVWARHALPTRHTHKYEDQIKKAFRKATWDDDAHTLGVPVPPGLESPNVESPNVESPNVESSNVESSNLESSGVESSGGKEKDADNVESPPSTEMEAKPTAGKDEPDESPEGDSFFDVDFWENSQQENSQQENSRQENTPHASDKENTGVAENGGADERSRQRRNESDAKSKWKKTILPEPAPVGRSSKRRPENRSPHYRKEGSGNEEVENPQWKRP